jgi:hypothetical protein
MWISNARNNFAPFAGFMLRGYEKTGPGENGEEVDDDRAADETTESKIDDVPV